MIRINLAPPEVRRRPALALPAFNLVWVFIPLYVLAVVGVGWAWWSYASEAETLKREVQQGEKDLQTLKAQIGQTAAVRNQIGEAKKRVQAIEQLTKDQSRPIQLFDAFVDVVPGDLWITALEQKDGVLRVSGTALTSNAVSELMNNLRASQRFRDVEIVVARQDLAKSPSLVTFEVTCRFEG